MKLSHAVFAVMFLPTTALAADLAPRPLPPPAFTWTGFYIGAQVGYGWAR